MGEMLEMIATNPVPIPQQRPPYAPPWKVFRP